MKNIVHQTPDDADLGSVESKTIKTSVQSNFIWNSFRIKTESVTKPGHKNHNQKVHKCEYS